MARDFAHKNNGGRQTASRRGLPGWLWLLVGVALGFAGAVGYYISRPAQVEQVVATITKKEPPKKITIPPKQQSKFTFYDLLPKYEVVVPKEALKRHDDKPPVAPQEAEAAPAGQYVIQVGSFANVKEAEGQKAKLALIGIESRIEKVTIDNSKTWYRVRIGPEKDQRAVEGVLARLEENDISAVVMAVPAN